MAMSRKDYDPAKTPGAPLYSPEHPNNYIDGPGGATINLENDEKGILETSMQPFVSSIQAAELRSSHDSFRQGIYRTNSVGDGD